MQSTKRRKLSSFAHHALTISQWKQDGQIQAEATKLAENARKRDIRLMTMLPLEETTSKNLRARMLAKLRQKPVDSTPHIFHVGLLQHKRSTYHPDVFMSTDPMCLTLKFLGFHTSVNNVAHVSKGMYYFVRWHAGNLFAPNMLQLSAASSFPLPVPTHRARFLRGHWDQLCRVGHLSLNPMLVEVEGDVGTEDMAFQPTGLRLLRPITSAAQATRIRNINASVVQLTLPPNTDQCRAVLQALLDKKGTFFPKALVIAFTLLPEEHQTPLLTLADMDHRLPSAPPYSSVRRRLVHLYQPPLKDSVDKSIWAPWRCNTARSHRFEMNIVTYVQPSTKPGGCMPFDPELFHDVRHTTFTLKVNT